MVLIGCSSSAQQDTSDDKTMVHHRVDVAAFKEQMKNKDAVLLDVRTPQEINKGKIEGAMELNIKAANFETELGKLDKNKTYLVYCQGGTRSNKACKKMEDMGFKELYDLKSGYKGWVKAN